MLAITGASGFIASACVAYCNHLGFPCVSLCRTAENADHSRFMGAMDGSPIPPGALAGCSVIIHAAARAHILRDTEPDPIAAFRRSNTTLALRLGEAAIAAGIRRFVFISSIGVLGNHSTGQPLRPADKINPIEDYARSKAEAEDGLRTLCEQAGMELVIVRPPLVHGPGAKGNFQRLMAAIYAGKRLPLGGVDNRRSFVGVVNLANALIVAATAALPGGGVGQAAGGGGGSLLDDIGVGVPIAARPTQVGRPCRLKSALRSPLVHTYHIADDGVISTRQLVEVLAEGMGVQPRFINIPRWLAVGGATLLGKGALAKRLFYDLEVDDSDFRRDFAWRPAIGLEDGLRMMAADYVKRIQAEGA